jgi:hypothetical protein
VPPTCNECWGFLHNHDGGTPCPPGSYERNPKRYGAAP